VNYLTVSTLNTQIKSLLESSFFQVYIKGEISNLTYHSSGHIYFSIKDESSIIKAVMFRGNASKLKFKLEVGKTVLVNAAVTVYTPRGDYQLNCFSIEPFGIGNLHLAYEQLKEKLKNMGYFDTNRKKTVPKIPKRVGIITSNTGAAIEDMKKVASQRWPLVKLIIFPTIVQGEDAKYSICQNIDKAQSHDLDVLIVGRGGGSFEDLYPFSEEIVANSIFNSKIPIVSAVGHESDYSISDLVADIRASTPSNAMEIVLPDVLEYYQYIDDLKDRLNHSFGVKLNNANLEIKLLKDRIKQNSIAIRFEKIEIQLDSIRKEYINTFKNILIKKYNKKEEILKLFKSQMENILIFNKKSLKNNQLLIESLKDRFRQNSINIRLQKAQQELDNIKKEYFNLFKNILIVKYKEKEEIKKDLYTKLSLIIGNKYNLLENTKLLYSYNKPKDDTNNSLVQVVKNDKNISLEYLHVDDIVFLQNSQFLVEAKVLKKEKIKV
jgi:exodeoxyribonuclease VII large subunit